MKIKKLAAAVIVLSLTTSGMAFAQNYGGRNDDGRGGPQGQRNDRDQRDNRQGPQRDDRRGQPDRAHMDERGAGPNHEFRRGQRLPPEYRGHQYVVDNWRDHHLSAPPRGYHWVQTGADYVLVAVATGVILNMILGQ